MNATGRPAGIARPSASRSARRVFDGGELCPDPDGAPLVQQRVDPGAGIDGAAGADLVGVERTEIGEQVVEVVGVAGAPLGHEALELELQLGDHRGIEQLAQLLGAEEVAEQVAVEGEGGDAAFGERRVALVHVHRDPAEQQALRERRCVAGLDGDDPHASRADVGEDLAQRGEVEHVAEALARRLQQDREGRDSRTRPRAARRRAGAAATAACVRPGGGGAAAARARRSPGIATRTAKCSARG